MRLEESLDRGDVLERLLDPLAALEGMPRLLVSEDECALLGHGRLLPYRARDPLDEGTEEMPLADGFRCAVAQTGAPGGPGLGKDAGLALIAVVSATTLGWQPVVVWNPGPTLPE